MSLRQPAVALLATLLLMLAGCAGLVPQTMALRTEWPRGVPWRHRIEGVPLYTQQDFQCGPAALASTMTKAGVPVPVESLVSRVYLPARQGSLQVEMQAAPRAYGLIAYPLPPHMDDLLREVAAGNPVLVLQDRGAWPISLWHYTVVAGYDYPAGELILHDGEAQETTMPFTVFEYTWKKSGYWALVVMPPDRLPVTVGKDEALRAMLPLEHITGNAANETAAKAYRTYLDRWPNSVPALVGLANAEYRSGHLNRAETSLRSALAHAPDNPAVLNNLAQVLLDLGHEDEAQLLIERAKKQSSPDSLHRAIEATAAGIEQSKKQKAAQSGAAQ